MYTLVESCVRPGGDVRERDADPFPPGTSAPPAPNHVVEVSWSQSAAKSIEGQPSTGHLWESLGPWGCDTASRPLVLRSLVDSLLAGIPLVYPVEWMTTRYQSDTIT
jgi:hypothetical protein